MPALGVEPDPDAEKHSREHRAEPGGQDDGVAQGILTHEDRGGPIRRCPVSLRTEPISVTGLEKPSVHAEAG